MHPPIIPVGDTMHEYGIIIVKLHGRRLGGRGRGRGRGEGRGRGGGEGEGGRGPIDSLFSQMWMRG